MKAAGLALALLCAAGRAAAGQQAASGPAPAANTLAVAQVVGAPRGTPLDGAALDAESWRVGSLLRCPVCQGASIVDSPASAAVDMRAQVRSPLAAGYTEQQVLAYFEHSYTAFVRLDPPAHGVNLILWLAPLGALALGGVLLFAFLRRPSGASELGSVAHTTTPETPPDDPQLASYLGRVRSLTREAVHKKEPGKQ